MRENLIGSIKISVVLSEPSKTKKISNNLFLITIIKVIGNFYAFYTRGWSKI